MKGYNISSEINIESYIEYFKALNSKEIEIELTTWEKKIQDNSYNKFEFLAFLKILDILDFNSCSNDIQTIEVLNSSIEELSSLSDCTLDSYSGTKRQKELLDNINKSLSECEMLCKYYNDKITS